MKTRIGFTFGANRVDGSPFGPYQGWEGLLSGCLNDASDMLRILETCGCQVECAFDEGYTIEAIDRAFDAAEKLGPGDEFFLTLSGHGSPDEAVCTYNGLYYDTQLHNRVAPLRCDTTVIIDTCFSALMARQWDPFRRIKVMPQPVSDVVLRNPERSLTKSPVTSNYAIMAACSATEFSLDGRYNGAFTECLKREFQSKLDGFTNVSRRQLLQGAADRCANLYPSQHPQLLLAGPTPDVLADAPLIE